MKDPQLHQLLVNLAGAIRGVPSGDEHQALVNRFIALLAHLESEGLIESGQWKWGRI